MFESDQDDFFFVQLGKLYLLMMTKGKYVRMHWTGVVACLENLKKSEMKMGTLIVGKKFVNKKRAVKNYEICGLQMVNKKH